jgi:hypothetical protein
MYENARVLYRSSDSVAFSIPGSVIVKTVLTPRIAISVTMNVLKTRGSLGNPSKIAVTIEINSTGSLGRDRVPPMA